MDRVTEKDKFLELCSNARHFSTLRFAIMTVYIAISGALLAKFFDCSFSSKNTGAFQFFQITGVAISIIFLVFEFNLNRNLSSFWNTISIYAGQGDAFFENRSLFYKVSVPIATHLIYILPIIFWVWFAFPLYGCEANA